MRKPAHFILVISFLVALGFVLPALAITGDFVDFDCPVSGTKNKFWVAFSWGSYIYQYKSKFQLIFWPHTDKVWLYHCKKCHYTAFGEDFKEPPKAHLDATRKLLQSVKLKFDTGDYSTIPMFERLEIAEQIYKTWGRDDSFWCWFYRVKGYHLQKEKKQEGADAARRKALELAVSMMQLPGRQGERKELLLVSGAMRHYLRDDKAALADFEEALKLTLEKKGLNPEQNKNMDGYLTSVLREYIDAIKTGKPTDDKVEQESAGLL